MWKLWNSYESIFNWKCQMCECIFIESFSPSLDFFRAFLPASPSWLYPTFFQFLRHSVRLAPRMDSLSDSLLVVMVAELWSAMGVVNDDQCFVVGLDCMSRIADRNAVRDYRRGNYDSDHHDWPNRCHGSNDLGPDYFWSLWSYLIDWTGPFGSCCRVDDSLSRANDGDCNRQTNQNETLSVNKSVVNMNANDGHNCAIVKNVILSDGFDCDWRYGCGYESDFVDMLAALAVYRERWRPVGNCQIYPVPMDQTSRSVAAVPANVWYRSENATMCLRTMMMQPFDRAISDENDFLGHHCLNQLHRPWGMRTALGSALLSCCPLQTSFSTCFRCSHLA